MQGERSALAEEMDCRVAGTPRNDGVMAVIASEARQSMPSGVQELG
jgi:hypothetical protein